MTNLTNDTIDPTDDNIDPTDDTIDPTNTTDDTNVTDVSIEDVYCIALGDTS